MLGMAEATFEESAKGTASIELLCTHMYTIRPLKKTIRALREMLMYQSTFFRRCVSGVSCLNLTWDSSCNGNQSIPLDPQSVSTDPTYPQCKQQTNASDAQNGVRQVNIGEVVPDRRHLLQANAEQALDLRQHHDHGGAGRKGLGHGRRYEADNEAQLKDAHEQLHKASQKGQHDDYLHGLVRAELQRHDGHQAGGADGHLRYGAKEHIDDGANEGRVEAILRGEARQRCIGNALRYDGQAEGNARYKIRESLRSIVAAYPGEYENATQQPMRLLWGTVSALHVHLEAVRELVAVVAILFRILDLAIPIGCNES